MFDSSSQMATNFTRKFRNINLSYHANNHGDYFTTAF
jgi:hypothetical protein